MRKSANLTTVLTAAGALMFLAPIAPAQSSGSTGSGQSGQTGSSGSTTGSGSQSGARSSTGSTQSDTSASGNLSSGDRKFVMEAAQGGLAEVELGRLAAEKGSSDQVKQFGQKMVDDHSKANEELKDLASKKGITLPDQPTSKDKAMHDRLSKLSGAEFDRAYMKQMEKDHDKDVSEFRKASEKAKDEDIKQWAAKTLPTLQEHDRMAHDSMAALTGTSGTTGAASSTGRTGTSTDRTTDRGDQSSTGERPKPNPK